MAASLNLTNGTLLKSVAPREKRKNAPDLHGKHVDGTEMIGKSCESRVGVIDAKKLPAIVW